MSHRPVLSGHDDFYNHGAGRSIFSNKALELLGRHLRMFTDKVEYKGQGAVNIILEREDDDAEIIAHDCKSGSLNDSFR